MKTKHDLIQYARDVEELLELSIKRANYYQKVGKKQEAHIRGLQRTVKTLSRQLRRREKWPILFWAYDHANGMYDKWRNGGER